MDSKIIEALKKNEKPFGLTTDEMQEAASKLKRINFEYYQYSAGGFLPLGSNNNDAAFIGDTVYRLRPDYQPEPEIVECEIKPHGSGLHWHNTDGDPVNGIDMATRCPDFIGFKYEDGCVTTSARRYKGVQAAYNGIGHFYQHQKHNPEVLIPTHVLFRKGGE